MALKIWDVKTKNKNPANIAPGGMELTGPFDTKEQVKKFVEENQKDAVFIDAIEIDRDKPAAAPTPAAK